MHVFKTTLVGILSMILSQSSLANIPDAEDIIWLHNTIQQFEPTPQTGVALGIIQNGKVRFQGGFGYRDQSDKKPVTTKTAFQVGSATKAFASLLFLMLEKENGFNLSAPVNQTNMVLHLRDHEVQSKISALDILSHRTGVASHDLLWTLAPLQANDMLKRLPYLDQQENGFRNSFIYNNLMYMALGTVLEDATGKSWHSLLKEKILDPLNMHDSSASFEDFQKQQNRAQPYFANRLLNYRNTDSIGLAGGLTSNVEDMTKWLQAMLGSGHPFITPESFAKLIQCHNTIPNPENFLHQGLGWFGHQPCYGLGWFVGTILESKQVVFHSGNIDGFSSLVLFIPEDKTGVVILTNQSVSPFPGLLAKKILSKIYGNEITDSFPLPKEPSIVEPPSILPISSVDREELLGKYINELYGEIAIEKSVDALSLRYFNNNWRLEKIGADQYSFAIELFGGLKFSLPLKISRLGEKVIGIEIPFALNPQIPANCFQKN